MWISRYFVLFSVFSCMGWIYETIYCTVKNGKWDNRGFLFGPVCPIYGVGGTAVGILFDYIRSSGKVPQLTWWQIFIIAYIGSVILEYVTHWYLEKKFHAYWWDYSDVPLNINGRVCVPASIGFGCAGILIYKIIYPAVADILNPIPPILMELLGLVFMALLSADLALTVAALTNILKSLEMMEEMVDTQMESVVNNLENRKTGVENRLENTLEATREKLTREHMERALRNMGGLKRGALTRIKGFRPYQGKEISVHPQLKKMWLMAKTKGKVFAEKTKLPKQFLLHEIPAEQPDHSEQGDENR